MRNERQSITGSWKLVAFCFLLLSAGLCLTGDLLLAENPMNRFPKSPLPVENVPTKDSPLIGGGIKRPPDIGAAGTASPTPPVRTESPTDEPDLLPDQSPVPSASIDSRSFPGTGRPEVEPLGDPEVIQEEPVIQR